VFFWEFIYTHSYTVEVIYLHYFSLYHIIIVSRKWGVLSFEPVCTFVFSYNVILAARYRLR